MDLFSLAPHLKGVVARLEQQLPYASAWASESRGTTIRVTPKSTAVEPRDPLRGVVLSAFTGRTFVEVSTNDLTASGLDAACAALLVRAQQSGVAAGGPVVDAGPALEQHFAQQEAVPAAAVPLADKVQRAQDIHQRLTRRDARLVHSVVRMADAQTEELFINRTRTLHQNLARGEAVVFVVMGKDGHQSELHAGRGESGRF